MTYGPGAAAPGLVRVERVGVRLRDEPHARPSGVGDHRGPDLGRSQGPGEQRVGPSAWLGAGQRRCHRARRSPPPLCTRWRGSHRQPARPSTRTGGRRPSLRSAPAARGWPGRARGRPASGAGRRSPVPRTSRRSSDLKATWAAHSTPSAAGLRPHDLAPIRPSDAARARDGPCTASSRSWPRAQVASWRLTKRGVDLLELVRAHFEVARCRARLRSPPPGLRCWAVPRCRAWAASGVAEQAGQARAHRATAQSSSAQSLGGGPQGVQLGGEAGPVSHQVAANWRQSVSDAASSTWPASGGGRSEGCARTATMPHM